MQIQVLGYYGGYPYNGVGTSGYLLQSGNFNLLIDCGSGVLLDLEKNLDPLQLDGVILSHYHHDHTADVGVLQHYWQLHSEGRKEDKLPIYGNTEDPLNFGALDWMNSTQGFSYSEDSELKLGPFTITFMKTHHPVPAFAMRIVENASGKVLVFTADSNYFDQLTDFAHDADLLITDTNFYSNKVGKKWHMTSDESGKMAKLSNSKKLLLSHLPQYGDLNSLLKEAQAASGNNVSVKLAELNQTIKI